MSELRVEGRASLDYRQFRELVLAAGVGRLLTIWVATAVVGIGMLLLHPAAGAVLLVGAAVALPVAFDLSLRRTFRRLSGGALAVDIAYDLTDEGMTISLAGTSTLHRWESLRLLNQTARYWRFRWVPTRRSIAVPKQAFDADARAEVDAALGAT